MTLFSKRRFPMMVVPIDLLLPLDFMEKHEEMKRNGWLYEWKKGMKSAIFVSHTWLGNSHPDPTAIKIRLLHKVLLKMVSGRADINSFYLQEMAYGASSLKKRDLRNDLLGGYCWLDYASVPQEDPKAKLDAIHSIPSYVQDCDYFLCLAPAARHENGSFRDLSAWKRRGWCRLEVLANKLSPRPKVCIVAESTSSVYIDQACELLFAPVCAGDFTMEADRSEVGFLVERMLTCRKAIALRDQDLTYFRIITAFKEPLLRGAVHCRSITHVASFEEWMQML